MSTLVAAGRVSGSGMLVRRLVLTLILGVPILYPAFAAPSHAQIFSRAVIFAIIGLSLNLLIGYSGQISLGHNAFVGVGGFTAAALTVKTGLPMYISIPIAAVTGALTAVLLGAVALRIKGLYLALITLAYGLVAQESIFGIQPLTGGGAGTQVFRPDPFKSDHLFAYVCLGVLAFILYLDWRMLKTKFGRALLALKSNEQVASSFGMNPVFYKISAFVLAGFIAGLAGGLLAFSQEQVAAQDFTFTVALTYVIMIVIGGLGSRVGAVIGSMFTALLPTILEGLGRGMSNASFLPGFLRSFGDTLPVTKIAVTALLLLLTITRFPGGIAQQIRPLTIWLSGKPFPRHHKQESKTAEPASPKEAV